MTNLGSITKRFADHLADGVGFFGADFSDFYPRICQHKDDGQIGLLLSQVRIKGTNLLNTRAEKRLRKMNDLYHIFVTEEGITFPFFEPSSMLCFTNEQPPEKVALLFLAALISSNPIEHQRCPACVEDGKPNTDTSTDNLFNLLPISTEKTND